MKLKSTDDIFELMDSHIASSALNVALELGLFWLLDVRAEPVESIARSFRIPVNRCRYWLELLLRLGLLEHEEKGYRISGAARATIVGALSKETWARLAGEKRERYPVGRDLALHIRRQGSVWAVQGLEPPNYVRQMEANLDQARSFTRMLYELHKNFAETVAGALDMTGVNKLMDLGGGSGVVSFSLLRRYPGLTSTIVDVQNVCVAGGELASEFSFRDRVSYHPCDFATENLPPGFDMVLECDVGVYGDELFGKVRDTLKPGGRFVIVDELADEEGGVPPSRAAHTFWVSLDEQDFTFPSLPGIKAMLTRTGFRLFQDAVLPGGESVVQAGKQ